MKAFRIFFFIFVLFFTATLHAQEVVEVNRTDGVVMLTPIASTDSITVSEDGTTAYFILKDTTAAMSVADIDSITFGAAVSDVVITYSADGVKVVNPYAFQGVDVTVESGNAVVVNSSLDEKIRYVLAGSGTGSFKLYSVKKQTLVLNGLTLTSSDGPAFNIQSKKKTTLQTAEGTTNTLTDASTYTACGSEDQKGTLFSEGQLVFEGSGTLNVSSVYKHAIVSDDYISVADGTINVTSAANDGLHANDYFEMTGGTLTVKNTTGDCIDAGEGYVSISGGTLNLTVSTEDTKAIKCDSVLSVTDGDLTIALNADQTKGLKAGQTLTIDGGTLTFTATGGVVVTDNDPSYTACIKGAADIRINGGTINITHSGTAGKGISADSAYIQNGGTIVATLTGAGGTYTNTSNESDTYNATAIKADGATTINAGTLNLKTTGTGGKCIQSSGILTIGQSGSADADGPTISATTTGSAINSSGGNGGRFAPGGGGGGNPGGGPGGNQGGGGFNPGGGDQSGTGGQPKAIRGASNVTVNSGYITVSTSQDGGEGIESKATLTFNGGYFVGNTYDDCLNAATNITVNGGFIYAYASNNDGIDSNGTLTLNGGQIFSSGTTAPEEGFDCDNNTFTISGGYHVGLGGGNSSVTSKASGQIVSTGNSSSWSNGTRVSIVSGSTNIVSFTMPRSYNSVSYLFSYPGTTTGSIKTGGSVSGGTTWQNMTVGGSYSN